MSLVDTFMSESGVCVVLWRPVARKVLGCTRQKVWEAVGSCVISQVHQLRPSWFQCRAELSNSCL